MDLVYVVTGRRTEDLRYSLRSMAANMQFGNVWLSGQPEPDVFTGVGLINVVKGNDRYRNTSDAIAAAIAVKEVSDPFILMNDDFFCLSETAHMAWDKGPATDTLIPHRRGSEYRRGGIDALKLLKELGRPDPMSFELHIPMVVQKPLMLDVIRMMREDRRSEAWKRTVYGNIVDEPTTSRDDVKIGVPPFPADDWVSTSNASFDGAVGDLIRQRYPYPSRFEAVDEG